MPMGVSRDLDDDGVRVVDDRARDVLEHRARGAPWTRLTGVVCPATGPRPRLVGARPRRRRPLPPRRLLVVDLVLASSRRSSLSVLVLVVLGDMFWSALKSGSSKGWLAVLSVHPRFRLRRRSHTSAPRPSSAGAFFAGLVLAEALLAARSLRAGSAALAGRASNSPSAGDDEDLADGLARLRALGEPFEAWALSTSMVRRLDRERVGPDDLDEPAVRGASGCPPRRSGTSAASSYPSASGGASRPRGFLLSFVVESIRRVGPRP